MYVVFLCAVGIILFIAILEKTGLEGKFLGKVLAVIVLSTLVMTSFLAIRRIAVNSQDEISQSNISP